jgi:hypothetical protein
MWKGRRSALLLPRIGFKVLSEPDFSLAGVRMLFGQEERELWVGTQKAQRWNTLPKR